MPNEIKHIVNLFTDMQEGDCWIGTNFKEVLKGIDRVKAVKHIAGSNSIWQLVVHLTYWRNTVVNRLKGSTDLPGFEDFVLPEKLDDRNWEKTLKDFEKSSDLLINTIRQVKEADLHKPSVKKEQTNYQLIHGCLQHDAYHLGQINLLKKQ